MKHLDGGLTVTPLPAEAGQQRVEIRGVAKPNSLLADEEAAFRAIGWGGALDGTKAARCTSGSKLVGLCG